MSTNPPRDSHPRICVVGSSMYDQVTRAPRLPAPGETRFGSSHACGFGGKGANQAVTAARLGAQVTLVSRLGRDSVAELTRRHYGDEGIDIRFLEQDARHPSGMAQIWVEEETGQNCILILPGANQAMDPGQVRRAAEAILASDVVLCQHETPQACALEAFRIARESPRPILTCLNPAPAAPVPSELLALTGLLVPNETEAAALAGCPVSSPDEARHAAAVLRERGAASVLITLGAAGAAALTAEGEWIHAIAPRVSAVDTTGAGDCFLGSLAFFLGSGLPMRTAMERACAVAAVSVTRHGAQSAFPLRSELDPRLFGAAE